MSTVVTENLQDSGGSVPVATVRQGSAKVWVNFNGSGTIAARDSFNVSSLTDNGVGSYSVNHSTALANANYAVTAGRGGGFSSNIVAANGSVSAHAVATGDGGSAFDATVICTAVYGD